MLITQESYWVSKKSLFGGVLRTKIDSAQSGPISNSQEEILILSTIVEAHIVVPNASLLTEMRIIIILN